MKKTLTLLLAAMMVLSCMTGMVFAAEAGETVTVSFNEAKRVKENGDLQATWKSQPNWMCVKVAEARCLKAAIPEFFSGTYGADELGYEETGEIAPPVDMSAVQDITSYTEVIDDDEEETIFDQEE